MAEIVGIAAGAIGILRAGTKSSAQLRDVFRAWNNAPAELLALHNEVEDLRVVVGEIYNAATAVEGSSQRDEAFVRAVSNHIEKARQHLQGLDIIMDQLSTIKKYKKKYKWVRQNGKVGALKGELRSIRERMQSLMVAHNVTKLTRIELELLSVRTTGTQERDDVTRKLERIIAISENTHRNVTVIGDDLQTLSASMVEVNTRTQQLPSSMADIEAMVSNAHAGLAQMAQLIGQFTTQMDSKIESLITWSTRGGRKGGLVPFSGDHVLGQAISFATTRRIPCPIHCSCLCHSNYHAQNECRLPARLEPLLGQLFIRYIGWPRGSTHCNSAECLAGQGIRIEATYTFPVWFLWYTIAVLFEKARGTKPELLLVTINYVPWHLNPLFPASLNGDIQLVTSICMTTPWRVRDKRPGFGDTALCYAIHEGHIDIVKLLLNTGANPDQENDVGLSNRLHAARCALEGRLAIDSEVCRLLEINELLADIDKPQLTKGVLHLPGSTPLEDYINSYPSKSLAEVNYEDELGRTALHWACVRGDSEAVRSLLKLGADPNQRASRNSCRYTPLHLAAMIKNGASCVNILCDAGAAFKRDGYGRTALHLACRFATVEAVRSLVRHGLPVEAVDSRGSTPLTYTSGSNIAALEYLLQIGANFECRDLDGDTALSSLLAYNNHECVDRLLCLPCDHLCVNKNGSTVLHYAARYSDTRAMNILARHGLTGLDPLAKDKDGLTAQDIFSQREPKSDPLMESWNSLLRSILRRNGNLGPSDEEDEGAEIFHDALEEIEIY